MKVAYKYRANPTPSQVESLETHFQIHANLYNKALETLNNSDEWISKYSMHKRLTDWKKNNENSFDEVNSKAAQQTVNRIYRAITGLSELSKKGEKVGSLRYRNTFTSIEYNQSGFSVEDEHVYLHGIGDVPITKHRDTSGETKGVTIKRSETGEWNVSVLCEVEELPQVPIEDVEAENVVGIDVNVENLFADTEGRKLESSYEFLEPEMERVQKEQRNLSRKQKGSNNWHKQKCQLAQAYEDLVNKRDDILHKLSNWYVENYNLIALEDVDSKELSEQGRGLGKFIRSQAWSRFAEFLEYKASQAGVRVEQVDPSYTSQDCSNPECGNRDKKSLSERSHECSECGFEADRDVNAAWNVLFKGIERLEYDSGRNDLGQGLSELTPVEIETAGGTIVPLSVVAEAGSPRL
jgi:putative transposase